jgi:hypothetical protein
VISRKTKEIKAMPRKLTLRDVQTLGYKDRVKYGRMVERSILSRLRAIGYNIKPSTVYEDMYKKIDGHIYDCHVKTFIPLQFKYRSSGNDLLMEMALLDKSSKSNNNDNDNKVTTLNGRDYISEAQVYICLASDSETLRICSTSELKHHGERLTRILLKKHLKTLRDDTIGQVRRVVDRASGREKVIFFANPEKLESYQTILL